MQDELAIIFIFGVVPISVFLMIIAVRYLENRENMAMIERGIDPKSNKKQKVLDPSRTLKNGMMFVGAGIGLLLAIIVTRSMHMESDEGTGIYFALIAVFGGLGMLGAYFYERKNPPGEQEM